MKALDNSKISVSSRFHEKYINKRCVLCRQIAEVLNIILC